MPQSVADQLQSIPMSPSLSQSLGRAQDFAREQAHRALTLEHLLLALTEDPDAAGVLRACNVDIDRLGTDVSAYLGGLLDDMRAPAGTEPGPDVELLRVIEAARQAAQQSRRKTIDGAIVLAAIVGDAKSPAAGLLKAHGMTFEEAIRTLQKASAQARTKQYSVSARPPAERSEPEPAEKPTPAPAAAAPRPPVAASPAADPPGPSGQGVDDILAAARARIQQRNAPAKPEAKSSPPQAEAENLPLMSLSSFTPPSTPVPSDLPPMLGRPIGPPEPAGPPQAAPAPPRGPASPTSAVPQQPPAPEPHGGPPPMQALVGEPQTRAPPGQTPPGSAPPGRLTERVQRADRPDGAAGPPRRTTGPNGAMPGQRRQSGEAARPQARPNASARGGQRGAAGPLIEAIPRRMRVGGITQAQVRIARDKVDGLLHLIAGNRPQPQPDAVAARALSVRLRAPDGGFAIEAETPETQWIEGTPGQKQDDHLAWRWEVMPLRRGRMPLQLVVSARTIGRDGLAADTAPPDRTIDVAVRGSGMIRRVLRWATLVVFLGTGIALGRFSHDGLAQDFLDVGASLFKHAMGLLRTSGFLGG